MTISWLVLPATLLPLLVATAEDAIVTNAPSGRSVEWTTERSIPIEPPSVSSDAWVEGQRGVLPQFLEAPNPLAPLNPLAPPPPRFTEATLNRDTVTGRVMGFTLVNWDF